METATFSTIWQKPPKAKENLENCRENKPYAICLYVVTCSNSAGNLGNGRKKLGLVPLTQCNHKNDALLQWEKHGNCNFFSSCPRWSAPTQSKNKKMAKKPIERMETATFSAVWQKPSKAKEKMKFAGKINHVPPAFISDMLRIRRKPGQYNFFSIFGRGRPKQRKTWKIAEKPIERKEMAEAA